MDEASLEKEYFKRRFMLARQSQTNGYERLEVSGSLSTSTLTQLLYNKIISR